MQRTIHYLIQSPLPEVPTIKHFLKSKGYSTQNLIALKKYPHGISLNGQPTHVNQLLNPEDILTVQIIEDSSNEKIKPVKLPLDIVYEDEDLMVVNKAAGMPTHPSVNNYDNTLANALAWYFKKQGVSFIFRCVNRLDKDTSGLTIIAKHAVSAGILANSISCKEYLAIVRGSIPPNAHTSACIPRNPCHTSAAIGKPNLASGTINAPIGRKPGSVIERMVDYKQGENAITHYQVLEERNGHSLVKLQLETGRTHQIRVHMKHLGYPLIGDYLYHPDTEFISRQALHSHHLEFTHPITSAFMEFTVPLPEDMQTVLYP